MSYERQSCAGTKRHTADVIQENITDRLTHLHTELHMETIIWYEIQESEMKLQWGRKHSEMRLRPIRIDKINIWSLYSFNLFGERNWRIYQCLSYGVIFCHLNVKHTGLFFFLLEGLSSWFLQCLKHLFFEVWQFTVVLCELHPWLSSELKLGFWGAAKLHREQNKCRTSYIFNESQSFISECSSKFYQQRATTPQFMSNSFTVDISFTRASVKVHRILNR